MDGILLNLLALGACAAALWRLQAARSGYHDDYLSKEHTQSLKGLLALLILLHHLAQATHSGILFHQFERLGGLVVSLFFFFTGYGLQISHMRSPGYRSGFFVRRIPAVLIPYLGAFVVYWTEHALRGKVYTPARLLERALNGFPLVSYSWFVINILCFYAAFGLMMHLVKERHRLIPWLCAGYLLLWIAFCRTMEFSPYWYSTSHLLLLGIIWAIYEPQLTALLRKRYPLSLAGTAAFFGIFFLLSRLALPELTSGLLAGLMYLFFAAAVLTLLQKVKLGNPILSRLGKISFEFYLFQGLVIDGLRRTPLYERSEALWCIAVLVCTTFVAALAHMLFSKLLTGYRKLAHIS